MVLDITLNSIPYTYIWDALGVMGKLLKETLVLFWTISEKLKKMPAKVYEHFEIPPDATGTVKVKCRHSASNISGQVETTSNFISHLKVCIFRLFECVSITA